MKYVVKCPYCEHTYFVNSAIYEEDFQCECCGGQNSTDDVIERVEDPIIMEKEVIKIVEKEVKPDPELQAIKNFNILNYPVSEEMPEINNDSDSSSSSGYTPLMIIFAVLLIMIFMGIRSSDVLDTNISIQEQVQREIEEINVGSQEYKQCKKNLNNLLTALYKKDIEGVLSYFAIEIDIFFDLEDFETVLEDSEWKAFWGQDVKVKSIEYVNERSAMKEILCFDVIFSNEIKKRLYFYRSDFGVMRIKTDFRGIIKNTQVIAPVIRYNENETYGLWVDDKKVTLNYETKIDKEDISYYVYTIPRLKAGMHDFKVKTLLGELSTSCMIEKDNEEILLDHMMCDRNEQENFLAVFSHYWYKITEAALNYADPSEIRQYFDKRIHNDEIEELLREIRTEIGRRGEHEAALITEIRTVEGGMFCPVASDTFLIDFEIDFTTINPEKPTGTCLCKLGIILTEEGWKIYENYDNRFFSLIEEIK